MTHALTTDISTPIKTTQTNEPSNEKTVELEHRQLSRADRKKQKTIDWKKRTKEDYIARNLTAAVFIELDIRRELTDLIGNARSRNKSWGFDLDFDVDFLFEMWKSQEGRCFYNRSAKFDLVNQLDRGANNRASLERLNPSLIYSKTNICLCCRVYNTRFQMTHELFAEMVNGAAISFDLDEKKIREDVLTIPVNRGHYEGNKTREMDAAGRWQCFACSEFLNRSCFTPTDLTKRPLGQCKSCWANKMKVSKPRKFLHLLIGRCKSSTLHREKVHNCGKRKRNDGIVRRSFECSVNLLMLVDMFIAQRGRCAYSLHPMLLEPGSPWSLSVERIDESLSYTRENIVLICTLLQAPAKGTQWTRERFLASHPNAPLA